MEMAHCGNIKINSQSYLSKIITRHTITLASEDEEASLCRELQTESIASVLPCKSELLLEPTGQRDGVAFCSFTS